MNIIYRDRMPIFLQKLTNATLQSEGLREFDSAEEAFNDAVLAALSVATDEVQRGAMSAIVEIEISYPNVVRVLHGAASINVARLLNSPVNEADNDII